MHTGWRHRHWWKSGPRIQAISSSSLSLIYQSIWARFGREINAFAADTIPRQPWYTGLRHAKDILLDLFIDWWHYVSQTLAVFFPVP